MPIKSIFCFDYTKPIGHYDSLRNFGTEEMTYIGLALSTPKIRVNATPLTYCIPQDGANQIREYISNCLSSLSEVGEERAKSSPKYITIIFSDGSQRYYEHSDSFYDVFAVAKSYEPQEKNVDSPYAIANESALPSGTVNPSVVVDTHQTSVIQVPPSTKRVFSWGKLLVGLVVLIVATALISNLIGDRDQDSDAVIVEEHDNEYEPTPVAEPQSGTMLYGQEPSHGCTITVTAPNTSSCVVKLKGPYEPNVDRLSFYVRAGETVTVKVPSEFLYVYFASGDTWYGVDYLFGSDTRVQKDEELLDFETESWEYMLRPVTDGNLALQTVDIEEF